MKSMITYVCLFSAVMVTFISCAKYEDNPAHAHEYCSQNLPCAKGTYCRFNGGDRVFGTCELLP
ncbi:unnamed protein product [Cunninghamella echinulata]